MTDAQLLDEVERLITELRSRLEPCIPPPPRYEALAAVTSSKPSRAFNDDQACRA